MKKYTGKIMRWTLVSLACIVLGIVCVTPWGVTQAATTKARTAVDVWAEVAQNAVREGTTTDISDSYSTIVYIQWALTSATAHTGTKIDVQISSNTSGNDDWVTFWSSIVGIGTADPESLGGAESGGATLIEVASTVGLYDDDETRWIFIEDNVVATSELVYLVSHVGNTSITIQDGLANAHDASDILYDIAGTLTVELPLAAQRVRVMYDNTYDSDGATCHTHSDIVKVTGL